MSDVINKIAVVKETTIYDEGNTITIHEFINDKLIGITMVNSQDKELSIIINKDAFNKIINNIKL